MSKIDGGRTLKSIRAFLGLSQDEFAHLLGSTKTTVSRRENGSEAKLSLSEIVRLQDALAAQGKQIRDFLEPTETRKFAELGSPQRPTEAVL